MKKLLLFVLALNFSLSLYADFVEKRFIGQTVSVEEAVMHFNEWFGTGDSEFVLFFDETDEIGMRDMDYQQYINGVKVENCALYVHSRNGIVTLINGDVMPAQSKPEQSSKVTVREARKKANVSDEKKAERTFIHETRPDGDVFYDVYKITTDTAIIYVDVTTGEIRKSLPLIHGATTCNVTTKYNGAQSISCESVDGAYCLRNSDKNLRTCFTNMGNYNAYPSDSYGYTNSTTNWDNYYLTSVTISAVHNAWWDVLGEDSYPDLYIRIKDASGNYLFTSDYKQDCGQSGRTIFPITFYISKLIKIPSGGGITIEVYDEDLTSDTKGTTVTLNNNALGSYTWGNSSSNTQGSFVITKSHPAFDIQWGLEKAYDFYNNLFGLSGFDGQSTLLRAFLHNSGGPDNIKPEMDYAGWISIFRTKTGYYNNAYASGDPADPTTAHLFFGIGNEIGNSEVGLNTVLHEFTHLVTKYRPKGDLDYQGESGAINEGYSDAMAITNDVYMYGTTDWLYDKDAQMKIGGKQYTYIRNIKNPKAGGPEGPKPDTYGGTNWGDPNSSTDKGYVHQNNSIFTHWYYILCEGKTGTNDKQQSYSVSPIGMTKALAIIWRMHRTYLPPQATYAQARQYAIQSVKDLFPGDENALKAVTDAWYAVGVGSKYTAPQNTITVKAKVPSNWTNGISAWTWSGSNTGTWATLTLDGDWVSYTSSVSPLNIIFINGSNWSTDPNQTVDITLTESSCIQINNNGTSKCTYSIVDCNPDEFQLTPGKYVIVANRAKETDDNWYYMTSDLGTASTKRFQAVSTGVSMISDVIFSDLEDNYIWELEADGNNWKLKNGTQYISWSSGNSTKLDATGKSLTFEIAENQVQAHFNDGTNERYLSLNATTGNNYFAFYSGTNQITYLFFLPYDDGTTPPPSRDCETVPFTESFASSQGDFTVWNKTLPSGFTSIWNWDAQYGMVAKCIKGSTKYASESYLISPCIEIPETGKSVLTFSHAAKFFQNTSQMTLWISTNYDESDPNAATWLQLTIPNYPTGQNWNWFESGSIDLSAYKGQYVNIAFRYTSTTSYAPQWEIKNFAVKKTTSTDVEDVTIDHPTVTKILRDGQILIIRGDKTYTLTGQEIR